MTLYQRLLQYYLDSKFIFLKYVFFETSYHNTYCDKNHIQFFSEIGLEAQKKEDFECGIHVHLSDKQIYKYFSKNYNEDQLFAVIFAYWWGLSHKQIQYITNIHNQKYVWNILNFFLCNPEKEVIPPFEELTEKDWYTGIYFIKQNESLLPAIRQDTDLIILGKGLKYTIWREGWLKGSNLQTAISIQYKPESEA